VQYNTVITWDVVSFDLHKTAAYLYIEQLLLYNVLGSTKYSFSNSFKKKIRIKDVVMKRDLQCALFRLSLEISMDC
jgi:hypothetical protein